MRAQNDHPASKPVAWAFGLAPVILLLATWSHAHVLWQTQFRTFATPIIAVEFGVIVLSALHGFRMPRPPATVLIALLLLVGVAWSVAATAEFAPSSIIRTSIWTIHLLFGFAVANLASQGAIIRTDFPEAMVIGFVIFTLLMCAFVLSVYRPDYNWTEDVPAYSNIRWYGYYAAAVVGLCVVGLTQGRKGHFAAAVFALGIALWTGSRGTLCATVVGYLIALLLFPTLRASWPRFVAAILCGLGLAALLTWVLPIGLGVGRLADLGSSGRIGLWLFTIPYIKARPLFGWGEDQMRFFPPHGGTVHPHNVVLQVLLAWGVVGALLVTGLIAWLIRVVRKRSDEANIPFVLALLMVSVFSLFDGALFHVQSVATFVLLLALVLTSEPQSKDIDGCHSAVER